jgi:hypothetical protein
MLSTPTITRMQWTHPDAFLHTHSEVPTYVHVQALTHSDSGTSGTRARAGKTRKTRDAPCPTTLTAECCPQGRAGHPSSSSTACGGRPEPASRQHHGHESAGNGTCRPRRPVTQRTTACWCRASLHRSFPAAGGAQLRETCPKKKKRQSVRDVTRSTAHDRMSRSDRSTLPAPSDSSTCTRSPSMQNKKNVFQPDPGGAQ